MYMMNESFTIIYDTGSNRSVVLNTSPLFKSTDGGSNWSSINTGISNKTNDLKYFNSKFHIVSNATYLLADTSNPSANVFIVLN